MTNSAYASFCYAAGNVSVINVSVRVGQIVSSSAGGFAGQASSLSDCYALGEVFAYSSLDREICAGSLVGAFPATGIAGIINCSFARGDVIVQTTGGTATSTRAGGLVGTSINFNTIRNSVSLAGSITVMGFPEPATAANRRFSRILGMPGEFAPTLRNNHAYIDMKLYHKTNASAIGTKDLTTAANVGVVSSATGNDGADVTLGILRRRTFWQTTLGTGTTAGTMGFRESVTIDPAYDNTIDNDHNPTRLPVGTHHAWNFSTVESRGYPILRTSDGSIMGGQ
jgi:hypothetical protein